MSAAAAPLLADPTPLLAVISAIAAVLLATQRSNAPLTAGGLLVAAEVGAGPAAGWGDVSARVAAAALVALVALPRRRLVGELTAGVAAGSLVAMVPAAGPVQSALAGLTAAALLVALLAGTRLHAEVRRPRPSATRFPEGSA